MPDWASLAVAVGAGTLLLVLAVSLVTKLAGSPFNAESEPVSLTTSSQERSLALLREVLEAREYEQLIQRGYLDISSPSDPQRIYRIRRNAGLVSVFEQGKAKWELCVQPTEPLPNNDLVVMHKLMIQGNEQEYLAQANRFPTLFPRQRYRP
jgi:hypothetical protein